jgi:hypothetical protein
VTGELHRTIEMVWDWMGRVPPQRGGTTKTVARFQSDVYFTELSVGFRRAEYRLVAKKGEGTFSEVLKAQAIKNGKYVAIKCMKSHFTSLEQVCSMSCVRTALARWWRGGAGGQGLVSGLKELGAM